VYSWNCIYEVPNTKLNWSLSLLVNPYEADWVPPFKNLNKKELYFMLLLVSAFKILYRLSKNEEPG
jgi:hypothetical protein